MCTPLLETAVSTSSALPQAGTCPSAEPGLSPCAAESFPPVCICEAAEPAVPAPPVNGV